jgi:methylmalonyl-CoA epimerase
MRLHHIGCAVRDMAAALGYYTQSLGLKQTTEPIEVASQKVRVCFLDLGPGIYLELVEGLEPGSPVDRIVSQTGGGVYHLCFEVENLDAAIERLRGEGFFRLKRFEMPAHGMRRFAFMLTPDRQLFELCEADKSGA